MPNENNNKLVNLADLKAAFDEVNDKAGVVSVNGQAGAVSITPANIGAHPAHSTLQVTNNSSYTGTPTVIITKPIVQILDSSGFVRHQVQGVYSESESFYTYIAARRPSGSSAVANQIGIGFDANGNGTYSVSYPEAFRSAIGVTPANIGALPISGGQMNGDIDLGEAGATKTSHQIKWTAANGCVFYLRSYNNQLQLAYRPSGGSVAGVLNVYSDGTIGLTRQEAWRNALGLGNVNNSLILTAATGTALYEQLNALPVSPANGAGVTCYINNGALQLLIGKTDISGVLHGVITRASSTRFRVFGMYGYTGYIMYWAFDITSAGAITPMTVYKLQGTAM